MSGNSSLKRADDGIETMRVLVCSTGHVTESEARLLDDYDFSAPMKASDILRPAFKGEDGWIFYVETIRDDDRKRMSEGFAGAMDFAERRGFCWIRFVSDGRAIPGIPTYHW